jgi:hypothetical protein
MTLVIPLHIEVTSLSSIVRRGFFMIFASAGKICGAILTRARDVAHGPGPWSATKQHP